MRPPTFDMNRPHGRFCFLGTTSDRTWFHFGTTEKVQERSPPRHGSRAGVSSAVMISPTLANLVGPIGPLWSDLPSNGPRDNRTTVVRCAVFDKTLASSTRLHLYRRVRHSIEMHFLSQYLDL